MRRVRFKYRFSYKTMACENSTYDCMTLMMFLPASECELQAGEVIIVLNNLSCTSYKDRLKL